MREDVVMPQMGESVAEGTVTVWLKEIGDFVERDEPLFEITTDKVDAEVPSPVEGVLVERLVDPGMTVEINTIVARIDTNGAGGVEEAPAPAQSQPAPAAPAASAAAPQPSSPASRPVVNGAGVAMAGVTPGPEHSADELRRTRSTPLVRKIAAEHGIEDLSPIPASGRGGRVTRDDILGFIERGDHRKPAQVAAAPAASSAPAQVRSPQPGATMREIPALPPVQMNPRDTIEPMAPQRLAIARHMVASRATSAHANTVHEVDFGAVVAARKALKGDFAARGVKLTFTAFMVQAFGQALAEFPLMNASVDADDNIIYRGDINVGVAVALDDSLIVPVVRNVDELSLLGIARAVNDLAERARTKKLKPDEVRGGTFTVSNHGVFGPEFGIPVINQPQVGIVATGAIKKRVVVDQKTDAILVRPTSIFCMSFDHRVIDGATADKFLKRVREILENWTV
ncbi:MAG: dihydrolipoamide acetyltransferase family protein [Myxococcota bacterium]|nr:dihydrolipoamide acetyltransferase family protein [Myxococcota bacterium]